MTVKNSMPAFVAFLLALTASRSVAADEELERQRGTMIKCCDLDDCVEVDASIGCHFVESTTNKDASDDEQQTIWVQQTADEAIENTRSFLWFKDNPPPYHTPRGWIARALQNEQYSHVIVGTVERSISFYGEHPYGGWRLMTWCTLRIQQTFKGLVGSDGTLTVLFDGGVLGNGIEKWGSASPHCNINETSVFSLHDFAGFLRPGELSTFPLEESASNWRRSALVMSINEMVSR